eukprot:6110544-Amphidinium_carterae.2
MARQSWKKWICLYPVSLLQEWALRGMLLVPIMKLGLSPRRLGLASSSSTSCSLSLLDYPETDNLWSNCVTSVLFSFPISGILDYLDTEALDSMKVYNIKWRARRRLAKPEFDPQTKFDCLFLCLSYMMSKHNIGFTPQEMRVRVHKMWASGASCRGGKIFDWASASTMSGDQFLASTLTTRWGIAAGAWK